MEAEVIGLSDVLTNAIVTREFLKAQGYQLNKTIIFHDNSAAITAILSGGIALKISKHINIRNFWIKEQIDDGEFEFEFTKSEVIVADILTKPITGKRLFELQKLLLNLKC